MSGFPAESPEASIKLREHLDAMLRIDGTLYGKILDTPDFAYHFNEICNLARTGVVAGNSRHLLQDAVRLLSQSRGELEQKGQPMSKPQYSQDIIRRYREMTGAFRREVKQRVAVDLNYDRVTLSCGHEQETHADLVDAMGGVNYHCRACEKEWLAKAVEDEKRNG